MLARREAALEEIRKLNPYRDITDPMDCQREMREDRPLLTRNEDDFKHIPNLDLWNPFSITP